MMELRPLLAGSLALLLLAGCGDKGTETTSTTGASTASGAISGKFDVDGSSTVFPIVNMMGDDFAAANAGVKMTVNKVGTGSGFQKFERGEIAICTASRPIKAEEDVALKKAGIEYMEVPLAYDGVSIVVNPGNTWAQDMTVDQLKKAFSRDGNVKTWADVNPAFPADPIKLYGPTDNHGTYEYFQEAVLGKKKPFSTAYQANQEYNAIIQSVAGDKAAIAYVGFNYFAENMDKVKSVKIAGVAPTAETISNGTYTPLSRALFLYVDKKAYATPAVKAFVDFALSEGGAKAITEQKYVVLPTADLDAVKARVAAGTTGSAFMDAKPGQSVAKILGANKT